MTIQQYKKWCQVEGLKPSLGSTLIQLKKANKNEKSKIKRPRN